MWTDGDGDAACLLENHAVTTGSRLRVDFQLDLDVLGYGSRLYPLEQADPDRFVELAPVGIHFSRGTPRDEWRPISVVSVFADTDAPGSHGRMLFLFGSDAGPSDLSGRLFLCLEDEFLALPGPSDDYGHTVLPPDDLLASGAAWEAPLVPL